MKQCILIGIDTVSVTKQSVSFADPNYCVVSYYENNISAVIFNDDIDRWFFVASHNSDFICCADVVPHPFDCFVSYTIFIASCYFYLECLLVHSLIYSFIYLFFILSETYILSTFYSFFRLSTHLHLLIV